jgi:NTE family protein
LRRARNERFAEPGDVAIDLRGALGRMREYEYLRYPEARDIGRRVARQAILDAGARLRPGAPPAAAVAAGPGLEGAPVREIEVHGTAKVREEVVRAAFGVEPGRPFTMAEALRGMDEVYATRLFESVWLDASATEGGARILVDVHEAPRFTLEVGGGYDEGSQARAFVRIRNRNLLGRGERIDTTLLASDGEAGARTALTAERPFGLPVGVFTRGYVLEEKPRFFRGHTYAGRAEFDRAGLAAGLQRRLGLAGLVRVGFAWDDVHTQQRPGLPFATRHDRRTALLGEAAWDVLDDVALPGGGAAAAVFVERTLSRLGTSRPYWRAGGDVRAAATPHRRLVLRGQALAFLSGGDLPVYEQARVGGPVWMPGFHRDELWGAQALAGSVTAAVSVYGDLRVLARLGSGNVWDGRSAVSLGELQGGFGVGLELPTRFGPVAFDWGRSAGGVSRFYVSLGHAWGAFTR